MIKTYEIEYAVGGTYKTKRVQATNVEAACRKARLGKSIVDIQIVDEKVKDPYQLRDF